MPRIRTASRGNATLALVTLAVIAVGCGAPSAVGPTAPAPEAIVSTWAPDALNSEATPVDEATARPEAVPPAPAASPPAAATTAIVPGSVHRTSLAINATYDVAVRLGVADRRLAGRVTISARNRSGGGIDRLLLNTVMAKLGALDLRSVTVGGKATNARIDGQTIVVPLGGVLPDGATTTVVVRFAARLRSSIAGSTWLFTRANGIVDMHRWIPWISRKRRFERPNHGDPFVTRSARARPSGSGRTSRSGSATPATGSPAPTAA